MLRKDMAASVTFGDLLQIINTSVDNDTKIPEWVFDTKVRLEPDALQAILHGTTPPEEPGEKESEQPSSDDFMAYHEIVQIINDLDKGMINHMPSEISWVEFPEAFEIKFEGYEKEIIDITFVEEENELLTLFNKFKELVDHGMLKHNAYDPAKVDSRIEILFRREDITMMFNKHHVLEPEKELVRFLSMGPGPRRSATRDILSQMDPDSLFVGPYSLEVDTSRKKATLKYGGLPFMRLKETACQELDKILSCWKSRDADSSKAQVPSFRGLCGLLPPKGGRSDFYNPRVIKVSDGSLRLSSLHGKLRCSNPFTVLSRNATIGDRLPNG